MALIPVLDVLPFYVAQEKGYFEAEGLEVELLPIKSAQERDALLQAGEADGALTDLQGVAVFNREESQLKVVAKARKAYPEAPLFRIVAGPGVEVNGPDDMAGVPVGISQNTVIEYLTERLLETWGLPLDQLAIEEVSAIPVRFELLMEGQLPAATLPDPLASAAIAAGGSLVVDDSQFDQVRPFAQSVLAFNTTAIERKPDTIRAFLRAWNKAVADINADPNAFRRVLIENTRVPPNVQDTYNIPPFPSGEITSQAEWQDVVEWALEKELLDEPVPYERAIDPTFEE
jgi:NitT/TauT family transport system substrate-binding protein